MTGRRDGSDWFPRPPDFIGIGAQKAGTWWLRTNLARDPRVWMPPIAELHYFDRPLEGGAFPPASAAARLAEARWSAPALKRFADRVREGDAGAAAWWAVHEFLDQDDDWYRMLFGAAPCGAVAGEITPRYALCGDAEIGHMHEVAPAARLLLLLRHPVHRFWSQCKMKHADGTLAPGEPAAMRLFDTPNGRPRGEYSKTILRFCRHYDPSQVLVVFQDGISREPGSVLHGVCSFLGLSDPQVDDRIAAERVNEAADPSPIPEPLRVRIAAAYRSEMETLADVFGGHAAGWLEGEAPAEAPAAVPLSAAHVDSLERRAARRRAAREQSPRRVFCVSMQRSGTTSVGDWLEAHGLERAGSPTSVRLGWSRLWMAGRYEEIFASREFRDAEILEDDPWWCPGFHRHLAERFPEAKFVLLTRDPDSWFESLCHHSGGRNPGQSDLHARIYGREDELLALLRERPDLDPASGGLLSILEHADHYRAAYLRHIEEVRACFACSPDRLFCGRLEDERSFHALRDFAGVPRNQRLTVPRSNARTEEMAQRLAAARARDGA